MTRRRRLPSRAGGPSGRPRRHDRSVDIAHGRADGLVEELRRAEAALREQKDLAETLLRTQSELGEGVLVVDDGRVVYANDAVGRLLGYTPEELEDLPSYLELIAPEHRPALDERFRGTGRGLEPLVDTSMMRRDGTRLPVEIAAKSMHAGHGSRLVALVRDLSLKKAAETQRLQLAAEQAARLAVEDEKERWTLLARLGATLAASLDFEARLQAVPRALVPALADWCAIHLQDPQGRIRLAALEHLDPQRAEHGRGLSGEQRIDPAAPSGVALVLRTGESELRSSFARDTAGAGHEDLDWLRELGVTSRLTLPLTARGRTFGTLLLATAESGRRQDLRTVAFAHEVARAVALSLDNARLHAEAQSAQASAESALSERETVAEIGRAALAGTPLDELFQRAVHLVAATAGADFAHIFELDAQGKRMLLRAGVGWPPDIVGKATVGAHSNSHAGFTLDSEAPVIVEDLSMETRFRPSQLLIRHGVSSGVMVPIHGGNRPFGVLGAHTRRLRKFTTQDVLFLQAVAHVLATALARTRMEQVVRENEERLRTVVMGAPLALFALDAQGRFTLSEGSGLERLGILPKRVLGRTVAEALPRTPALADQARRALAGETVTGLVELDGQVFETRLSPVLADGGAVQGVVGVATDVTERRRGEQRRGVQYAVSRLLSEADSIEEAGPRLLQILGSQLGWDAGLLWIGSKAETTMGCAATWQASAEPPDGLLAASRSLHLKRGQGVGGIVWSTGKPVWLRDAPRERIFRRAHAAAREGLRSMVVLPITSPRDVFGVLEIFAKEVREPEEDLLRLLSSVAAQFGLFVERRLALLEVRRLNAELESRVGQRTRELEAANRELEAFSYSVSHDLRAPLRTIDGFSKALLEDYAGALDEEGRRLLDRVRLATQRMAVLIDDLLQLSRITRADMQRSPVDLGAIVEGSIATLKQQEPERNVEVAIQPGLVVPADPTLLRVALENLIGNAWKFTRGRDLTRIEFGVVERDGESVYFVRDNGAGFDMRYANKLFVPFQRLHRATEFEGTGVGLATVQRVVQRHGGRVWAEGAVGQGATFYFTLPPKEPSPRPRGSPQSSPS